MNVFVLCVIGLFYSTQSASMPVTFNSNDNKSDDRGYPIFQDLKHFGERLYSEPENSSSVLVSKSTSNSKVFLEELGENTEGDITNPRRLTRSVLRNPSKRWPNKTIPYVINPSIGQKDRQVIYNAIEDFHRKTCLKFKERSPQDYDYVLIKNYNTGCHSAVGKKGGEQVLNLKSPGCYTERTVIHELLHVVGFVHEQSRPDRDDYVTINHNNIKSGKSKNFKKYNDSVVDNQEMVYDFNSLMHYSSHGFSKNGEPTIEAKRSTMAPLGQRVGFSEGDIQKVWKMYQCIKEEIGDGKTTITDNGPLGVTTHKLTSNQIITYPRPQPTRPPPYIIRRFTRKPATSMGRT